MEDRKKHSVKFPYTDACQASAHSPHHMNPKACQTCSNHAKRISSRITLLEKKVGELTNRAEAAEDAAFEFEQALKKIKEILDKVL